MKFDAERYENKLPWPYNDHDPGSRALKDNYQKENARIEELFATECIEGHDIADNDISRRLFGLFYEDGDNYGSSYKSSWKRFDDYAKLYRDAELFFTSGHSQSSKPASEV